MTQEGDRPASGAPDRPASGAPEPAPRPSSPDLRAASPAFTRELLPLFPGGSGDPSEAHSLHRPLASALLLPPGRMGEAGPLPEASPRPALESVRRPRSQFFGVLLHEGPGSVPPQPSRPRPPTAPSRAPRFPAPRPGAGAGEGAVDCAVGLSEPATSLVTL